MTKQELIAYCMTFPGAYEDYPFGEEWTVMRHRQNSKGFAFIFERGGNWYVNLKCEPMQADFWRNVFAEVTPGYHMNKVHWNTVCISGAMADEDIFEMVEHSFSLIRPRTCCKNNKRQETVSHE